MKTPLSVETSKSFRLGGKIVWTLLKNSAYSSNQIFSDLLIFTSRCGILLLLYKCVYDFHGGDVNGASYQTIAWSIFLYFLLLGARMRSITDRIEEDVQSGRIEMLVNKPVSYLGYRLWSQIGESAYSFLILSPIMILAMVLFVGIPATMTSGFFILTVLLALVLGAILTLMVYGCLGILAFWIQDVTPIFWIVDKFMMVLGGSYLPIAFFPPVMYQIAVWSPFGAMQFVTHTVYANWPSKAGWMLGMQCLWILIFALLLEILYRKAREKLSVNGG
jgi:ABC-2 type transport system permease protein